MTYLLVMLTIIGYILNIKRHMLYSYLVWTVTNSFWIGINYSRGSYDLCIMFGFYLLICTYGVYSEVFKPRSSDSSVSH